MKYPIRSGQKERVRVPGTIRQVAIYVHHRASRGEVREVQSVGGHKEERDGEGGVVSHPNSYAGLNGPRLIRHKRLILKNSGRDKPFPGATDPPCPSPPSLPGSYGASERSRLSRRSSFH